VDRNHGGNDPPQLSGTSMEDVLSYAHELRVKQPGKKFELEHWWRLLHDHPKWRSYCNPSQGGSSKPSKINELGGHSDTFTPNSGIRRKAIKRKAKETLR